MDRYAQIIVISKTKAMDQLYTYRIPDSYIGQSIIGLKVLVPFGRGNALREGFVFETTNSCSFKRIKKIKHFLKEDITLDEQAINLIKYLRRQYLCTYTEALQLMVPSGTKLQRETHYTFIHDKETLTEKAAFVLNYIKESHRVTRKDIEKAIKNVNVYLKELESKGLIKKEYIFKSVVNEKEKEVLYRVLNPKAIEQIKNDIPKNYVAQIRLIDYFLTHERADVTEIKKKLNIAKSVIDRIIEMGIATIDTIRDYRDIDHHFDVNKDTFKTLNTEQQEAFNMMFDAYKKNKFSSFLLHGITGSGKTEVYMHLVDEVIKDHKSVIILVPEIALTPQMIERFMNRFGNNIAILHSKLSLGEAFDQWKSIKSGQQRIVIGARSAVFSPIQDLGLVIIDEEHENTYKSNRNPKYETYNVAKQRLKASGGLLVSGSATPRLESYQKVKENEMKLLKLNKRVNKRPLPSVKVIDMREELNQGNKTIFSQALYKGIQERLKRNEQSIIFLNRKGYSSFVACRQCGFKLECPNCEISLTYHKSRNVAECSYCEYKSYIPKTCPECESQYFKLFGIGTEKVEEIVKETFPDATVGRLDSQTTQKKGSLNKIIEKFENSTYDIMIGTQMVTKGFDFENVTLVGILAADLMINFPDFSSSERAFQLITQVAGRAGRGEKEGHVILQTYEPEHPALVAASVHDYNQFMKEELKVRRAFKYPPYVRLINLIFSSKNENVLIRETNRFKKVLSKTVDLKLCEIYGPNHALHKKIRNRYRYQIFLKVTDQYYEESKKIISEIIDNGTWDIYVSIDVEPRNLV